MNNKKIIYKTFNRDNFNGYNSAKIDSLANKKSLVLSWYLNINNKDYNKKTRDQILSIHNIYKYNRTNNSNDWKKFESEFNKLLTNNELFALKDNNVVGVVNKSYAKKTTGDSISNYYIDNLNDVVKRIEKITYLFDLVGFGYNYIHCDAENYSRGIKWVMGQCSLDTSQIHEFDFYKLCAKIYEKKNIFQSAIKVLDSYDIIIEINNGIDDAIKKINDSDMNIYDKHDIISTLRELL